MKYDPTGIWFEAFKALGEPSEIYLDFQIKNTDQSIKYVYAHSRGDATAAMNEIAEKFSLTLNKAVEKPAPQPITLLTYLKQILLFNYYARPRREKLWPSVFSKANNAETPYAYFVIEKAALDLLKAKLLPQKISLNTYLLFTLNQATRSYLKPLRKELTWIVPVNFRRELGLAINANGNQAANFTCAINDETAAELQQKISSALKDKRHWGVWFWQNSSAFMPFAVVKFLTRLRLHPNYNAGVFTNLGAWTSPTAFSHFTFFANPIYSHPIVASALEINGDLTLGIRLYPSFPLSQTQLNEYLQTWKYNILSELTG